MLPREHRMVRSSDFSHCVRRGSRGSSRTLTVHLLGSGRRLAGDDRSGPALVGLVVGKSVGNAVHRNLVQRRLRHLLRQRTDGLDAVAMLVVRAQPSASGSSSADLAEDLDHALAAAARREARRDALPARNGG